MNYGENNFTITYGQVLLSAINQGLNYNIIEEALQSIQLLNCIINDKFITWDYFLFIF